MTKRHPDEEQLHDFLFGELEIEQRTQIEAHVTCCDECALELRRLAVSADLVKTWGKRRAPGTFLRDLKRRLAQHRSLAPLQPVVLAWLGVMAAYRVWELVDWLLGDFAVIGAALPRVVEALSVSAQDAIGIVVEVLARQWLGGSAALEQLLILLIGIQLVLGTRKGEWAK